MKFKAMNINNNLPPKKASVSLVFGFVGILLGLSLFLFNIPNLALVFLLLILEGMLVISGLVIGIKSLKVLKSITAVAGIILCVIAILIWMYELLFIYAHL